VANKAKKQDAHDHVHRATSTSKWRVAETLPETVVSGVCMRGGGGASATCGGGAGATGGGGVNVSV